jgi:hypothetical protein
MRVPGMPPAMKPEELYRRLGRIIEIAPAAPPVGVLSPEFMKWVAQANALVNALGDLTLTSEAHNAINGLHYPDRAAKFQQFMLILHKVLALTELELPAGAQGAFIPVGNAFQAYAEVAKILGSATKYILIVDPYMDDSVLTDFANSVPANVSLRLLTDEATVKPNLSPAATRWKQQFKSQPLEVRFAPARTLHDRAFLIDGQRAWTITQSLKDLAKRSPAEIVRADDTASLKKIWSVAKVIV